MIAMDRREVNALLAVHSPISSRFKVDDALSDVRILALADFAFAVEIPCRLRQSPEHFRPFLSQDIVDMMHGSDVRLSTFKGSRDAKQTHQVRGIGVKELAIVMSA